MNNTTGNATHVAGEYVAGNSTNAIAFRFPKIFIFLFSNNQLYI
jgi:hypothetical protein